MNLLVLGMSSRDEFAFDMFMKRQLSGWHWQAAVDKSAITHTTADIVLLDLAASGLARHSGVAQSELAGLAGGRVSVLLVSSNDTSWATAQTELRTQPWVWLGKPYNAESMRLALLGAAELFHGRALTNKTAQIQVPGANSSINPPSTSEPKLPDLALAPTELPIAPTPIDAGMDIGQLALRLSVAPPQRFMLLRKILAGLQSQQPFELRFTVQHLLLIDPKNAWVAGNTPVSVVQRVCGSDALAASVILKYIAPQDAEQKVLQLGLTLDELPVYLMELADKVLPATVNSSTMPI